MVSYAVVLDVLRELTWFVSRLLAARRQIGTSGIPLWVSDVLPGNVHDLAAAWGNVLDLLRPFCDAILVLADPGYEGAGHGVHVPVKKPAGVGELDIDTRPGTR